MNWQEEQWMLIKINKFNMLFLPTFFKSEIFSYWKDPSLSYDVLVINGNSTNFLNFMRFLKNSSFTRFDTLVDIFAVDNLNVSDTNRFEMNYLFSSSFYKKRILIKFFSCEVDPIFPSLSSVYKAANWAEREIWDMYGIYFDNHPDLRRILTDYGFDGHPLRKDFPVSGYLEVRYDDEQKKVVLEPIMLAQEYRVFDFVSPWDSFLNSK
jgi:NADH/F420H2 dehydrogenase subunit C